jgi:hypothetical protein
MLNHRHSRGRCPMNQVPTESSALQSDEGSGSRGSETRGLEPLTLPCKEALDSCVHRGTGLTSITSSLLRPSTADT